MADVTIVSPSSQVQTVGGAGQSSGNAGGAQGLSQGSTVSGTIAGRDTNGNYLLKTSQGTFAIRSSTPLTYNSDVTIRIGANLSGNVSARIVSVNGEPFADFATPEAESTDSVSSALLTQSAGATPAADSTQTAPAGVRALVVSAPAPVQGQPENTGLTQGATVLVRASQTEPETQAQSPANVAAETFSTASASIQSEATAAVQPQQVDQSSQLPSLLQQAATPPPQPQPVTTLGTLPIYSTAAPVETDLAPAEAVTQVDQVLPNTDQPTSPPAQAQVSSETTNASTPGTTNAAPVLQTSTPTANLYSVYTKQSAITSQPQPTALNTPTGNSNTSEQLPAQVVSTAENGTLNLSTPLGPVTVQASSVPSLSALPPGTALTLEVVAAAVAEAGAASSSPASLNELASSWQSLKDIVNVTADETSQASASLLARLPELGANFVSQSTAFISALIQGEARQLLGDDVVESLKLNDRADLLEKFSSEATSLSTSYTTAGTRETPGWQTLFLPFVFQEALQQARIYVKRDIPKKERASKQAADTRFVVEVDLTEIGPLQLDGLVRQKEQTLAFDLIVRSHNSFSPEDQSEMLSIYTSAAELTGFKGSLAFQVTRDFPVKPLEEINRQADHSITV